MAYVVTKTPMQRWALKVRVTKGCWLWTGTTTPKGYGRFWNGSETVYAYRFAYRQFVGPIPAGLQIDHLCRNPACVNPSHLEPVTAQENLRRGTGFPAINALKTHCKHGHEFTPENTYVILETGQRRCRACNARIRARAQARKRAA